VCFQTNKACLIPNINVLELHCSSKIKLYFPFRKIKVFLYPPISSFDFFVIYRIQSHPQDSHPVRKNHSPYTLSLMEEPQEVLSASVATA
jgi:hypothetical protein